MNILDIVIGVVLLFGFYSGFKKGLFVALASLIGLVLGVYGAVYFSDYAGAYISNWFDWGPKITSLAAFAVTFLLIVFTVSLLGKFLTKILDFAALGMINKLLGGAFSALMYAFIISVIFLFLNSSSKLSGYVISDEKKNDSILYDPVSSIAPILLPHIIGEFDEFNDIELEGDQEKSEKEKASN